MADQDILSSKKRAGSPFAQPRKKRTKSASKITSTSNDPVSGSDSITRYPTAFRSEKGHEHFTKLWWKEVAARDDFWKEMEANIPVSIWKKRLVVRVALGSSSDTSSTTQCKEKIVEGDDTSKAMFKGSFRCEKCSGIFEASAMANFELLGVFCGSCAAAGEILDREKAHENITQDDSQVSSVQSKKQKAPKIPAPAKPDLSATQNISSSITAESAFQAYGLKDTLDIGFIASSSKVHSNITNTE